MDNYKDEYSLDSVLKRFATADTKKSNWKNTYEEVLEYVKPQKNRFNKSSISKGTREDNAEFLFDSTATLGLNNFVSNLHMSLVPPMKKWCKLGSDRNVSSDNKKSNDEALEKITDIMFSVLKSSNFDTAIASSFEDLCIGTGALMIQKTDNPVKPLNFISVPLDEIFLEEGAFGYIETVFRKFTMPVRNITKTWVDAEIPAELQKVYEACKDKERDLLEATLPKKIQVMLISEDGRPENKIVDGYVYYVIDLSSKSILVKREQQSSPWVVFRWSVSTGDIYGKGPATLILADIKTLNKTKELLLKAAAFDVAPPIVVADSGVINVNTLRISPNSIIPVDISGLGGAAPISFLERKVNVQLSQIIIENLINNINASMFINPMGPLETPVRTATEVSVRQQELAKRIGSAFGRLQYELITPLVNRILYLLDEIGMIDLAGFKIGDGIIGINPLSPLAVAQDQEELSAIMQYVQFLLTFGPQMAMPLLKVDKLIPRIADLLKIPVELVPSVAEFKELSDAAANMTQQPQPM